MPSSYPAGFDSFGNPIPTDALDSITLPHATDQHARMNDAIEAVQATLGLNPQGTEATVAARIAAMETEADVAAAAAAGIFDIVTAKGDLIVGTDDDTVDILPAGPDGRVLVADSAEPTGLNWVLPASINGIPPGGLTGQILVKLSDDDNDVGWETPSGYVVGSGASIVVPAPYPTGGTITTYTDGVTGYQYRVHTFLNGGIPGSGETIDEFVNPADMYGHVLVQAAGGGGGGAAANIAGGTGGAGALWVGAYAFGAGSHTARVGAGGVRGEQFSNNAGNGGDTRFDDIICYGGGAGRLTVPGTNGGSGGGSNGGTPGVATYGTINGVLNTTDIKATNAVGYFGGGVSFTSDISGTATVYASPGLEYAGFSGDAPDVTNHRGHGGRNGYVYGAGSAGSNGCIIVRYRIA